MIFDIIIFLSISFLLLWFFFLTGLKITIINMNIYDLWTTNIVELFVINKNTIQSDVFQITDMRNGDLADVDGHHLYIRRRCSM